MVATDITVIGHEMSTSYQKNAGAESESEVFVVQCSFEGVRAMARVEPVQLNPEKTYIVSRAQYNELLNNGIPHKLLDYPVSFKPPIVKVQRK
jgi:hypothetical protein